MSDASDGDEARFAAYMHLNFGVSVDALTAVSATAERPAPVAPDAPQPPAPDDANEAARVDNYLCRAFPGQMSPAERT